MRINKYIASSGLTSRRKADELIESGEVRVNGELIEKLGYDVEEGDIVEVSGRKITPEASHKYLLMNKPVGFLTTLDDEFDRETVMSLLPSMDERVYPVGRLDMNTSGLLIFTNDGKFANGLTHPSTHVEKTYKVLCTGTIGRREVGILSRGVDIGDYVTAPCRVSLIKHLKGSSLVEITIHEGKNRQVRRMFKAINHPVQALERVAIGEVRIAHMPVGTVRKLTEKEVSSLKALIDKNKKFKKSSRGQ